MVAYGRRLKEKLNEKNDKVAKYILLSYFIWVTPFFICTIPFWLIELGIRSRENLFVFISLGWLVMAYFVFERWWRSQ